jgi:hypothetical protein
VASAATPPEQQIPRGEATRIAGLVRGVGSYLGNVETIALTTLGTIFSSSVLTNSLA